ncbi:alpha/beta fold hydrolase [Shewanella salipaludis]|uniref:Proline iminopeptidase n=1 Tax=Shewanella salipaludis TaxID=2723052 RepID=A0A972JMA1_9GAMM|nr:alpha/beta fold hydrolase [Shewanella salipaludis]NMH66292.1 alpha/beta fold hydrolase [Shewanella salipaludis]
MTASLIRRDWLAVGEGHELHLAQYGNPKGVPLLYLHGGPGAGCSVDELSLFDGRRFRILLLDQRGAGLSRPSGELAHNDLEALLADIEKVRLWLGVRRLCLVGGSFGATLGLIYSGRHPDRVLAQVYWGLFIPSRAGLEWLYGQEGAAVRFPQAYGALLGESDCDSAAALIAHYYAGVTRAAADTRLAYVRRWLEWELALALPGAVVPRSLLAQARAQALARIELHFAHQGYFAANEHLFEIWAGITAQTQILQANQDWVCPPHLARQFQRLMPQPRISYREVAGHHLLADNLTQLQVRAAIAAMELGNLVP